MKNWQSGVTLVEMIAVVTIVGILAGIAAFAGSARPAAADPWLAKTRHARHMAAWSGTVTVAADSGSSGRRLYRAFPDGRVVEGVLLGQ